MINYILKKTGRLFIDLARKDSIDPGKIKNILVISLPYEEHLRKAVGSIKKRFKNADCKIILPDFKIGLVSHVVSHENIFTTNDPEVLAGDFDAVVILSLNPFLVWKAFRRFKCPKLLYNYCDEWYLLRVRPFFEIIKNILALPFNAIYIIVRFINVSVYIIVNLLSLALKKITFRLSDKIS